MIITYFRSSSYNRWDFCPHLYFIEYCLGWSGKSGKKADKGTIVHKVMEILALAKKAKQEGRNSITDNIVGVVSINTDIDNIVRKVYDYYSEATPYHDWYERDYRDCKEWTWTAIQYNDRQFDPRKRDIVDAEPFFDFEIQEPWATFSYEIDGKTVDGFLGMKGTIDLITRIDDKTLEVVDYKTGKRLDWATGKVKTQESLYDDPQLRIYHLAAHQLYPDVDQIIITIYYINDGGPFTICFDKSDLAKTKEIIKQRFLTIKQTTQPRLNKSWKCSKFCDAGKTTFRGTNIEPFIEWRDGEECQRGDMMTKCEQVKYYLEKYGLSKTMLDYSKPGFTSGKYKNPGEIE